MELDGEKCSALKKCLFRSVWILVKVWRGLQYW